MQWLPLQSPPLPDPTSWLSCSQPIGGHCSRILTPSFCLVWFCFCGRGKSFSLQSEKGVVNGTTNGADHSRSRQQLALFSLCMACTVYVFGICLQWSVAVDVSECLSCGGNVEGLPSWWESRRSEPDFYSPPSSSISSSLFYFPVSSFLTTFFFALLLRKKEILHFILFPFFLSGELCSGS